MRDSGGCVGLMKVNEGSYLPRDGSVVVQKGEEK